MFKPVSRPIAETPTLYGKDAKKFLRDVKRNQKKVSKEEMERIRKNYEMIKSISNFEWS